VWCSLILPDIDAVLRNAGLPGAACAETAAGRYALAALGLAVAVLVVSTLFASTFGVSALGVSTFGSIAGRSTYFGASDGGGASAVFGASTAFGAGARADSTPPNDKLRSPACAAADVKTNPAMRMNLRMFVSPLEVDRETTGGDRIVM
jgi:hypothetical protein